MTTVLLLICSNIFMTIAWYGHVWYGHRYGAHPALGVTIAICWLIALPEYALQVPANRIGSHTFTTSQLKIIQEVIAIGVFLVLNVAIGREWPRWNEWFAFGLILAAVVVARWPTATTAAAG
jgi:uncharacterized protein